MNEAGRCDRSDMTEKSGKRCHRYGCRKQALRKFCSDACRIAHHNSQRPPADKVKVTCQGCGKVFQGRPDQKSCSATCRSRLFGPNTAVASIRRPIQCCLQSNGGALHRFHPLSFGKECRNSTLSPAWSTPGYLRSPRRSVYAVLSRMLIRCAWILGSMTGRHAISS